MCGTTHLPPPSCRRIAAAAFKISVSVGEGPLVEEIGQAPRTRIVEIDVIGGRGGGTADSRQAQDRASRNRTGGDLTIHIRRPERVEQLATLAVGHAQRLGPRTNERCLAGLSAHRQRDRLTVEFTVTGIRHRDRKAGTPDITSTQPERVMPIGRNVRDT